MKWQQKPIIPIRRYVWNKKPIINLASFVLSLERGNHWYVELYPSSSHQFVLSFDRIGMDDVILSGSVDNAWYSSLGGAHQPVAEGGLCDVKLNRVCLSINIDLECVKNGKKHLMFLQKKNLHYLLAISFDNATDVRVIYQQHDNCAFIKT